MNNGNLRSYTKGSKTAKENGAKGGKASGETKREKKRIKDVLSEFLEMDALPSDMVFMEYDLPYFNNAMIVAIKIIEKAKSGDVKAVRLLLELTGELERNKVVVNNNTENIEESELYQKGYKAGQRDVFANMTDAELYAFTERLEKHEEIPADEKPLVLPDGRVLCGESQLE